jgi:hypothetical protein
LSESSDRAPQLTSASVPTPAQISCFTLAVYTRPPTLHAGLSRRALPLHGHF